MVTDVNDQTKALRWIADFCRTKRLGTDDWFDLTEIEITAREALSRVTAATQPPPPTLVERVRSAVIHFCPHQAPQGVETPQLLVDRRLWAHEVAVAALSAVSSSPVDLLPLRTALNTGAGLNDPATVYDLQVLLDQAEAAMRGGAT